MQPSLRSGSGKIDRRRTHDHEAVLDAWAEPRMPTAKELSRELGVPVGSIRTILRLARRRGDVSAVLRPTTANKRGGKRRTIDYDAVLDAWAEPRGPTGAELARKHGVTVPCIRAIILRARRAGDARAVERPKNYRPGGTFTAFFLQARTEGTPVEVMAKRTGWSAKDIRKVLVGHDRRAAGKCRMHGVEAW